MWNPRGGTEGAATSVVESGGAEPGTVEPNAMESDTGESGAGAPGTGESGTAQSAGRRAGEGAAVTTWGRVGIPHATKLALALCVLAFAAILFKARRLDFFYDEWSFLTSAAHWHLRDYFVPHNEHWSTIPMLIYKVLLTVNGTHSYLPFMAVLLLLHASAAFLLFLIVRRRCGDLLGLIAAGTLLFLGRGAEDILWAFQIGFVGSVVFGLFALYLLNSPSVSRRRAALASAGLLFALMSSGIGLFFCAATAVDLAIDRARRRLLWVLVVPGLAYAWWYEAFGAKGVAGDPSPLSLKALKGVLGYAPEGIGSAAAGTFSLSTPLWSPIAFAAFTATVVLLWYRKRTHCGLAAAAAVGIVLQFTLTGLVRSQFGDGQASAQRYIYVGSVFVMLIMTEAVRDVPWRGIYRAVLPITALCMIGGGAWVLSTAERNRMYPVLGQRPILQITWLFRAAPGLDRNVVLNKEWLPVVTPALYDASRSKYGSPLPAISVADLPKLNHKVVDTELRILMPLRITTVTGAPTADCRTAIAVGGHADLTVPGGSAVTVFPSGADASSKVNISTWYVGSGPDGGTASEQVAAGSGLRVGAADTGLGLSWRLRVNAVSGSAVTVCGNDG